MAISSTGIGSGLNVESIITQLTALEQRPLTKLKTVASTIQTRLSALAQIKSQVSALSDAAFKLTLDGSWRGVTVNSSRPSAVSGSVSGTAAAASFGVEVAQLARSQSVASSAVPVGASLGTGTLTIEMGSWNLGVVPPTFPLVPSGSVSVVVAAGEDTLAAIAQKINDSAAGLSATVLRDASGERLLVRSRETGEATGFRIQVSNDGDGNDTDNLGLSRLAFDLGSAVAAVPPSVVPKAAYGMGANEYQAGRNAQATINGVPVSSASNSLSDAIPGLKLQFSEVTTGQVEVTLAPDLASVRKNMDDFVAAYNALNKTLSDATRYDAESRTAGVLQGDPTAVGLQNALRNLLGSSSTGSTFARLADVGISLQVGGALAVNGSKRDAALQDLDNLKKLFTADNGNPLTNGFGLKVKDFARGLLATGGLVTNRSEALEAAANRNLDAQAKVTDRIALVEKRLRAQYSALDLKMGNLTALNAFVAQQVTLWNKSSG